MALTRGLGPSDRKLLAGIIHQVWRSCQSFVAALMEHGPEEAAETLDQLAEWSAKRRLALAPRARHAQAAAPMALRIGRELLDDVETFSQAAGAMMARLTSAPLDSDEIEEEALGIVEGFLAWTSLMAAQLGITSSLKPQTLWFER
ncbi:MAG TPA: hypothetical protein VGR25_00990 [bacterium]|nr:hypothetical protein [bacterium]